MPDLFRGDTVLQSQPLPLFAAEAEADIELSVLVPVHNEEDNIAPLVERVCAALKDFGKPWELIIVDDGSTDATLVNARKEFGREELDLRIVELQRNFGQAAALQAGIDVARGRLLATLDGDLQNDPDDIPAMIATLEERQLDLLCGWRKDRRDGLVLRLIPSFIANVLIRKVTGVRVHDYGCGLKLFRTNILKQVRIMGGMHRFIPALIASVVPTSRIDEMVVSHHPRRYGLSKYGISRTFRVVLDLLSVVFFMSFRHRPGHFFGVIGLTFGAASALLFLYLFGIKFLLGEDIGTRPMLIVAVMLFLASAQMITTGILAEILARPDGETRNYFVRGIHARDK
jgi:glycosyltransferase involved in cell wall biosynthesis